jgi:ribonuclease HII
MPHFKHELILLRETGGRPVCGIDEVGRGPWAGPVVAAAVIFDNARLPRRIAGMIDDSKALDRAQREAAFEAFRPHARIGIGISDVTEIDTINILQATFLAMQRAVTALPEQPALALVDGNRAPKLPCPTHTLIGGDAISLSIAAASIVAKVTRDRMMIALADEFPPYSWHTNVGYGTRNHQAALNQHGVTVHHRRTFSPIAKMLTPKDS